jgi:hypothetical protein
VLTSEPALGQLLGCEARACAPEWRDQCRLRFAGERRQRRRAALSSTLGFADPGAQMFANRLRRTWAAGRCAARECRLLAAVRRGHAQYSLAVDLYTGAGPDEGERWLYVQEYAAPQTVDPVARAGREALAVLPKSPASRWITCTSRGVGRRRGPVSVDRRGSSRRRGGRTEVRVNLDDYLDPACFLIIG